MRKIKKEEKEDNFGGRRKVNKRERKSKNCLFVRKERKERKKESEEKCCIFFFFHFFLLCRKARKWEEKKRKAGRTVEVNFLHIYMYFPVLLWYRYFLGPPARGCLSVISDTERYERVLTATPSTSTGQAVRDSSMPQEIRHNNPPA